MARNTTGAAPAGAVPESQNENVQPSGESTPDAATTTPETPATAEPPAPDAPDAPAAPAAAEPPAAPATPDAPAAKNGDCKVKNESCKGLTIRGVTGAPIVFDSEGVAVCRSVELDHFLKIPGYSEVK